MSVINLNDVTKRYDDEIALDGVDLTVRSGEIYGFLGPNGAGKSTTINLILDFIRPTTGDVEVFGLDAQEGTLDIRRQTGILPEGAELYDRLTGYQHIEFALESKDINADPMQYLERVGLSDAAKKKAGGYSKGMAQRLCLAAALVGQPDLLILDEPSTGLDPTGTQKMREIIREEHARGATVFFSSHILGQVEAVCDRVGILCDGQLVVEDSIDGLRESTSSQTRLCVQVDKIPADPSAALADLESIDGVSSASAEGTTLIISCNDRAKTTVLRTIEEYDVVVEDFETKESSLEDLFIDYTTEATS